MILEGNIKYIYWREVIIKTIYTMNRVQIRQITDKTLDELFFGHTPIMKYFRINGIKCYVKIEYGIEKFAKKGDSCVVRLPEKDSNE